MPNELGLGRICFELQLAVSARVAEGNCAKVPAPRLLGSDPLDSSFGVQFAFELRPDDSNGEEGPAIRSRGVDLLRDADEIDVLLADVLQEGEVIALVARQSGKAVDDDGVEVLQPAAELLVPGRLSVPPDLCPSTSAKTS